jgi:hypothetical protein
MSAFKVRKRRLWDAYTIPVFRPEATVCGIFGDPKARIIRLRRRSKKRDVEVVDACITAGTTARSVACAISPAATRGYFSSSKCGAYVAGRLAK